MNAHDVYVRAQELAKPLPELRKRRDDAEARGDKEAYISAADAIAGIMADIYDLREAG